MNNVSPYKSAESNKIDPQKNYITILLPTDLDTKIISYLGLFDLRSVCLLDKRRNSSVNNSNFKNDFSYRDFAFNSIDWKKYCNKDVDTEGEIGSFPKSIYKELNTPCPVFPGKRIGQTHMLTWIPKKVDELPLTLNTFEKVLKKHFPQNHYPINNQIINTEHMNQKVYKSGWVFMTDVLPESEGKDYEIQERLVRNLSSTTFYQVPSTLNSVVSICMKYLKSGECRFGPGVYTHCIDESYNRGDNIVVGGFKGTTGLDVTSRTSSASKKTKIGIAAQRKIGSEFETHTKAPPLYSKKPSPL